MFLIALGVAFSGYVLVSGNMSFWAAIVILNLVSVLPLISNTIINTLLGSSTLSDFGIRRFALYIFYLRFFLIILIIIHIIYYIEQNLHQMEI